LLNNTSLKTSLVIKTKGGDSFATVDSLLGTTPLKSLAAKGVNLTGTGIDLEGEGYIKKILLHDVLNGADIRMAGGAVDTKGIKIKINALGSDTDIVLDSGLGSLNASGWTGGHLTAPWAKSIKITGDLGADISLSSQDSKGYSLGNLNVTGWFMVLTLWFRAVSSKCGWGTGAWILSWRQASIKAMAAILMGMKPQMG